MTTLIPRGPYSKEELRELYPESLQLQLVQVLLRHGERSPVSARFQNAGLPAYWPYCTAAKWMTSVAMVAQDSSSWDHLRWRRRLETFGNDDRPVIASGPKGEIDAVCQLGELTDKGRETTLALGQRLRHLYVDQLGFMPNLIADADMIYLRATPLPRALESVQQSFWGMYPLRTRTASFPPPTIITRAPVDETLFPNESSCRRFAQLSRAFAQRTADRWNESDEMGYLTNLISKWMPDSSKRVKVDSHPRLSGVMDTINSTLAHGPETRLPSEFYDTKGREIIDRIATEEWFSGYRESNEYRTVGIGALVGDIVSRMVGSAGGSDNDGMLEIGGEDGNLGKGRGGEKLIKFGMSGCHDTTLAAILASLGSFEGKSWPPYTSHIALELFRKAGSKTRDRLLEGSNPGKAVTSNGVEERNSSVWKLMFGSAKATPLAPEAITGRNVSSIERAKLDDFYVRVRYNDEPITIPGCKPLGKHLEGDASFCTLAAFKAIADRFTPRNWKQACASNIDAPAFPTVAEDAGNC